MSWHPDLGGTLQSARKSLSSVRITRFVPLFDIVMVHVPMISITINKTGDAGRLRKVQEFDKMINENFASLSNVRKTRFVPLFDTIMLNVPIIYKTTDKTGLSKMSQKSTMV